MAKHVGIAYPSPEHARAADAIAAHFSATPGVDGGEYAEVNPEFIDGRFMLKATELDGRS